MKKIKEIMKIKRFKKELTEEEKFLRTRNAELIMLKVAVVTTIISTTLLFYTLISFVIESM